MFVLKWSNPGTHGFCGPTHSGSRCQPCAVTSETQDEVRLGWLHARSSPPM